MEKIAKASASIDAASRVIVALDVEDRKKAEDLLAILKGKVKFVKVGFELFLSLRPDWIQDMKNRGISIFFDHKFFDIPRTVEAGVRGVVCMGARCVTVHAERSTMVAALRGREKANNEKTAKKDCKILGVTVLTHMENRDIHNMGIDTKTTVEELVLDRARQAARVGIDGVIASGVEARLISSDSLCKDLLIVTPGVREQQDSKGDQKRVTDVGKAIEGGADYIVVGRPVVQADDPRKAFCHYVSKLEESLQQRKQETAGIF